MCNELSAPGYSYWCFVMGQRRSTSTNIDSVTATPFPPFPLEFHALGRENWCSSLKKKEMEQTLQGSELGSARERTRTEGQSQQTQTQLSRAGAAFGTLGWALLRAAGGTSRQERELLQRDWCCAHWHLIKWQDNSLPQLYTDATGICHFCLSNNLKNLKGLRFAIRSRKLMVPFFLWSKMHFEIAWCISYECAHPG